MKKFLISGVVAIAITIPAAVVLLPPAEAHTRFSTDVTWSLDVREIFERKCMTCHNPNGVAPDYVDLTFYGTDTKPGAWAWRASALDEIMLNRMPPWNPDPRFGEFQNSRQLTPDERDLVLAWINGNGPQGPLRNLPVPEQFLRVDWKLGQPDLIVSMPKGHIVPADQQFDQATVTVPVEIERDTYVTGYEFLVTNPRNIARVTAWVHDPDGYIPPPIEVEDKGPYDPLAISEGPEPTRMRPMPKGPHYLGQWLKGDSPVFFPDAAGMKLVAGSKIEMTIEYVRPDFADWSAEIRDNTKLGLFLSAKPEEVDLLVETKRIEAKPFTVPAGKTMEQRVEYTFDENVHLTGVSPELGPVATKFKVTLIYPDGFEKTAVWVPKYQQKWMTNYRFESALAAPVGTKLVLTGYYDNTADNWDNPNDPPADIVSGSGYRDEKLATFIEYTLDNHLKLQPIIVAKQAPVDGGGMLGGFGPDATEPKNSGAGTVQQITDEITGALDLPQEPERIRIAKNGYHQIQGMMHRPGAVSIYVYDDTLSPLDPRNFTGELQLENGEAVPLTHANPSDDFLSAWIDPALPVKFNARLDLGSEEETVPFEFDRLTPATSEADAPAAPGGYVPPPHGGWIETLEDSGIQVEATLESPTDLRLYFFDAAMNAIDPRNFSGMVTATVGDKKGAAIPLAQSDPRAEYLGAKVPETLPLTVTASVWVGDAQRSATFEFDELTEEPWDLDPSASAGPLVVGPHGSTEVYPFGNGIHSVEFALPRPGELRVYLYDAWKKPVDPALFRGNVKIGSGTLPLHRFSPGDDFLTAFVSPMVPFAAEATLWVAGTSSKLAFAFEDVTLDPTTHSSTGFAHMDHTPLHGGQFFMAPNNFHHVEGALPSPGEFRVYFYDDFKRPIDPRNFSATAYIEHLNDKTGEVTEDAYPMALNRPGDAFLTTIVPADFPVTLYAKVNLAGEAMRFDFQFDELTVDTGGPVLTSVPQTTGGGAPSTTGHSHYRPAMTIPTDVAGLLKLISEKEADLANRIKSSQFATLYQPALDIRDLVAALAEMNTGLDVRAAGRLKLSLGAVNRTVNKMDRAGDTADAPRAQAVLLELSGELSDIRKLFPGNV